MAAKKGWSYSAGERGRNRVRVFQTRHGTIAVEYYEWRDGKQRPRRQSLGHRDKPRAKREADRIASRMGDVQRPQPPDQLTVQELFDNYMASEVVRKKAASTQTHDRLVARLVMELVGPRFLVRNLGLREWDQFIQARRQGLLGGRAPVGERQIEYDLKTLRAALNWAVTARRVEQNPLKGLPLPTNPVDPNRPIIAHPLYLSLLEVAPEIGWRFELALILAHETCHRISSIRRLQWDDIDLGDPKHGRIRWRGEYDKQRRQSLVPITEEAVEALLRARARRREISRWVFPSPRSLQEPTSRQSFTRWFRKALEAIGLGHLERFGYQGLRRKFATELRHLPLADLMALGGWTDSRTLLECYELPDIEALERGLRDRIHSRIHSPLIEEDQSGCITVESSGTYVVGTGTQVVEAARLESV